MEKLYNIDLERAVISTILMYPENIEIVIGIIDENDFYFSYYKEVFKAIKEIYEENGVIDEILLKDKLIKRDVFNEEYFMEIISTAPVSSVEVYAKEIKDLSIKRDLLKLSREINELVDKDISAQDSLMEVESKLLKIELATKSGSFKTADEVVSSTLNQIKELIKKENRLITGVDTGFIELNRMTSGLNPGDLIIIAARPSMGKTAFALNLALNALKHDEGVGIFSLEMPAEQLMLRMLSAYSFIPLQSLRRGDLNDEEIQKLSSYVDKFSSFPLYIYDEGNVNINIIKSEVYKLKTKLKDKLSLIVIDYLQLINSDSKERHIAIAEISRSLKLLARELNIPIIALSQLNRSLESRPNKRPMLSDLRESGAIEQDADLIMFIYRDDVYKAMEAKQKQKEAAQKGEKYESDYQEKDIEEAEIIIGKHRNGPIGTVNMLFHKHFTLFTDNIKDGIDEIEPTEANIDVSSI